MIVDCLKGKELTASTILLAQGIKINDDLVISIKDIPEIAIAEGKIHYTQIRNVYLYNL